MRQTLALLIAIGGTAFGQAGHITGKVVDDTGGVVQGAYVTAALFSAGQTITLTPGQPPPFFPAQAKAPTGIAGDFAIDVNYAGQYYVCVEKPDTALLNPCLWSDSPVPVNVAAGATVSGVSVVAVRGVAVNVRVQDAQGLLMANPAIDDVHVGTFHRVTTFIPGRITARDPAGRTVTVVVPKGQAASISVSSSAFALGDSTGVALAASAIPIASSVLANITSAPALTVYVTGPKAGH